MKKLILAAFAVLSLGVGMGSAYAQTQSWNSQTHVERFGPPATNGSEAGG